MVVELVSFLCVVVKADSMRDVESTDFAIHSNRRWKIQVKCLHGSFRECSIAPHSSRNPLRQAKIVSGGRVSTRLENWTVLRAFV